MELGGVNAGAGESALEWVLGRGKSTNNRRRLTILGIFQYFDDVRGVF